MTHGNKNRFVEWTKYAAIGIAGIGLGTSLLGVSKCSELQTVKAAERFEADMKEEHRDFRHAIKSNTALVHEKFDKILERLPSKK
jgi:hypothetical protein